MGGSQVANVGRAQLAALVQRDRSSSGGSQEAEENGGGCSGEAHICFGDIEIELFFSESEYSSAGRELQTVGRRGDDRCDDDDENVCISQVILMCASCTRLFSCFAPVQSIANFHLA